MSSKSQPSKSKPVRFLISASLSPSRVESRDKFPYNIPVIRNLGELQFHPLVTFFVGENGTGKSTLIEGIAEACRFTPEGGPQGDSAFPFSELGGALTIHRTPFREADGYFLRAESFFNVANTVHHSEGLRAYGGKNLHHQSHGESFIALVGNRFYGNGLYILDEPEAALSPSRQLVLLGLIDRLARNNGSQFVIATHSPILLAYPHSTIYGLDDTGIAKVEYKDTEHYKVTLDFLTNHEAYLRHLTDQSQ
jgi:predicted ATPase